MGAHAEEADGAAVEREERRLAPARRDREHLVAPFGDQALGHQHLDHLVERRRDGGAIVLRQNAQGVRGHLDDARKAPQDLGIVAADEAHALAGEKQRQEALGPIGVAGVDVAQQAHAEVSAIVRLREASTTWTPTTWRRHFVM